MVLYEGDHAAAGDDAGPEEERGGSGDLGERGRRIGARGAPMDGVVEDERQHEAGHLELERRVDVIADGIGGEHQGAGDEHDPDADGDPAVEIGGELGGGLAAHGEAEQAEVNDGDQAEGEREAHEVETLYDREGPFGTVHGVGPRTGGEPLKKR